MDSLRIVGVDHAQITVPTDKIEEARQFYCVFLGLPEIPKPEALLSRGGFWLRGGAIDVHVGIEDGFDRTLTKSHLAYQVKQLGSWKAKLQTAGLVVEDSVTIPGCDRFEFRDPFGNRIEFLEKHS